MTFVTPKNHIVFLIISYSGFRPEAFFESLSLSPSSSSSNIRRSRRRQVLQPVLYDTGVFPPFSVPFHLETFKVKVKGLFPSLLLGFFSMPTTWFERTTTVRRKSFVASQVTPYFGISGLRLLESIDWEGFLRSEALCAYLAF